MRASHLAWPCSAAILALLLAAGAAAAADAPAATLTVGTVPLRSCGTLGGYCGTLERALDPAGGVPGTIAIYFEFYPHRDPGPASSTLVAIEGGPGFASTDSRDTYLGLFEPLRAARDVVLMDGRGTGRSGALQCEPLQDAPRITEADVGACGRSLGERAPLYSSAYAADDLAAVLAALGATSVDLYGDSYGTFVAQVFAYRHPDLLRSLTLDSAYPLRAPDEAWQPGYAAAMRAKFDLACARSPACAAVPGSAMEHLAPVLEDLRRHPRVRPARDADGRLADTQADATALARVMFGSAPSRATVRELDAAARAWRAGDEAPLLRLMAESLQATDSRDARHDPAAFSLGQSVAVMCQDAEQIFDMNLPPPARREQRAQRINERAARDPDLYAPFTMQEYRGLPLDYGYLDECVEWPVPPAPHPAQRLFAPGTPPPRVPVLVLIGELDNITTPANGRDVAARFAQARAVLLRNSLHVNARPETHSRCATTLVHRFIAALDAGADDCAQAIPPLRLVPSFAQRTAGLPAARALPGNAAGPASLQAVSAAVLALGDVLGRLEGNANGRGVGLRGGTFQVLEAGGVTRVALQELRFTQDLAVSGTLQWRAELAQGEASLVLHGPEALAGALTVRWNERADEAAGTVPRAWVQGSLGGAPVVAEAPAP